MSTIALRPRSGVELIDASFQFLRENFSLLFTASVAAILPIAVVGWLAAMNPGDTLLAVLSGITNWVFTAIAYAAAVVIVAKRYLGEEVTPADALRIAGRRFGTILTITFVYGLAIGIGMLYLGILACYWAAKYFAATPVAMVEGYGQGRSFERSAGLTDGSKWRVLGVYGLAYFIYIFFTAFVNAVLTSVFGAVIGAITTAMVMAATYPFVAVVGTLLYFDLRIRREGFDLDMMLDPAAATVPAVG